MDETPNTPENAAPTPASDTFWQRARLAILRVVAVLGAFFFVSAVFAALSGVYTSRPEFCRSCHNMEPYYVSWKESTHSHVSCVKCHFPPGIGEKIRGKMLGLVQLAKYVTSSEGPRPAAEVPDASCLRSGCHETRLLAGKVDFNGGPFDHAPHLTRMRRGKQLRCTSCHSQIVQGSHMTVTTNTCFLCHFKDEYFNQGLGTCTRCHEIPTKEFDLGSGVTFTHEMAFQRSVDCQSCHSDLIRGNGEVPHERCVVCHNRQHDLERIDDHYFLHQKHVSDHKVDCLECHLEIKHSADPQRVEHAAADCRSCHPDQHRQQINMLAGIGARTTGNAPSTMVKARITCVSCHQSKEVTSNGSVLWAASTKTCSHCHDNSTIDRLWAIHESLRASLDNIEQRVNDVRQALAALETAEAAEARETLDDIEADLKFLRVGNGIHNIHYASTLTENLVKQLTALCDQYDVARPQVDLPSEDDFSSDADPQPSTTRAD